MNMGTTKIILISLFSKIKCYQILLLFLTHSGIGIGSCLCKSASHSKDFLIGNIRIYFYKTHFSTILCGYRCIEFLHKFH